MFSMLRPLSSLKAKLKNSLHLYIQTYQVEDPGQMVTFPCGQIVWTVLSSIPSWQQWDWDSCMCERALIAFHRMVVTFLLDWTWEEDGAYGSLLAFCCQWSMSAYRFAIKWCSILGSLCACSFCTHIGLKKYFLTLTPHFKCKNLFALGYILNMKSSSIYLKDN